jgi:prepilin-type N-terminal cleavage/methylation domain-containing protein
MNYQRKRGYSVVELLVTIALLATILAISIGIGRNAMQRANFTSVLNGFMADFNYARQLASRLNRYVAIEFDDEGRTYTMLVQRNVGDFINFDHHKTVDPLGGQEFYDPLTARDFVVNSMGIIRPYPVVANAAPIQVVLDFVQKRKSTGSTAYKTQVTIFPSGGIKIEDN